MNYLFSLLKDRLSFWLLLPMLLLSSILSGMIFVDLDALLPTEISKNIKALPQPKTTVTLLLLAFAIALCYLLLFRTYSKKTNIKDYDLINPPGILKHRGSGKYYCQRCLLKDHNPSELSLALTENNLVCHCCDKLYDISTKILPDSYFSKAWDEFTKEILLKNKTGQQVNQGDG